jgi:hypothetical protein
MAAPRRAHATDDAQAPPRPATNATVPSEATGHPGEPGPPVPGNSPAAVDVDDPCKPIAPAGVENDPQWIDRMERGLREGGCRSARWIDGLFGQRADDAVYREVSGNVQPSVLWTGYYGFQPRLRFRIDLPLPRIDSKLRAFVGRVDREEFVTERAEPSGAVPRQFGTIGDEQTLLGLGYGDAMKSGTGFDLGTGIRLTTPLDPYVKASYRWRWLLDSGAVVRFRPTAFWQQSEQFGGTMRVDYDKDLADDLYTRLTASGTYSGRSLGLRGYMNATLFQRLSDRRAIAYQIGASGETDAPVALREYGVRTTYRQNVWRDWLVLELRASLTWPREKREEARQPSWGAGVGFEMVFGPGTFRGGD